MTALMRSITSALEPDTETHGPGVLFEFLGRIVVLVIATDPTCMNPGGVDLLGDL